MKLPVYKLDINEWDEETGIEFVSLVESPAIQKDFLAFNQEFVEPNPNESEDEFISRCVPILINEGKDNEQAVAICYSYWEGKFQNDYPQAARENAKRVLKYLEESGNPNDCLTLVGRNRANQIANGENLSEETLNRMKSFLSRHKDNERKGGYDEGCGNVALDAWGGLEILPWVEKKLRQFEEFKFSEEQSKQQLLAGPILIPDKMIYRQEGISKTEYYVYFSKDTVKKIAFKYLKDKNISNVNIEHNPKNSLDDVALVESWIVTDPKNDKSNQYGYELPLGTWFGIVQVKDKEVFEKYVESGVVRGFSLEGYFEQKLVKFHDTKFDTDTYILSEIENLLKQ